MVVCVPGACTAHRGGKIPSWRAQSWLVSADVLTMEPGSFSRAARGPNH